MEPVDAAAIKERIGDRIVIASVSGGKDSTAMCLWLQELGIPYRAVMMDTGWEHPDVYRFVNEVLPEHIGPIETISSDIKIRPEDAEHVARFEAMIGRESQMIRLVFDKAMFPARVKRFCTEQLKVFPMRDYLNALDVEPVNATGIRASESLSRSKFTEWEDWGVADIEQWRPILKWSDQDVVDIHKKHNVPPNPLYLRGAARVGCWPCIFSRKGEIRNVAETDPDRIELIHQLELTLTEIASNKRSEGEPETSTRCWFGARMVKADPVTGSKAADPWPIHKAVEWSLTKRGGRQFEMFAAPEYEFGCMRWGVCDTHGDGS